MAGQSLGLAKERRNVKREEKDMNGKDGRGKEELETLTTFPSHIENHYQNHCPNSN